MKRANHLALALIALLAFIQPASAQQRVKATTLQNAAAATGNGTALDVSGWYAAALQVSGTFSATVTFEVTVDDTNWIAVRACNLNDGSYSTTASAPGVFAIPLAGVSQLRARVSAYTSGSVTVVARQTQGVIVRAGDTGGAGGSGTVTSVGLSLPGIFSVSGSPVTSAGTLSASLSNQPSGQVFAGPSSGAAAAPGFRALVAADIPQIGISGIAVSSLTGNGSKLATSTGTLTSGNCVKIDAGGNFIDAGAACGGGGGSGTVGLNDGTAAAPSLYHNGDTGTGLFFGAGIIKATTGGTQRWQSDATRTLFSHPIKGDDGNGYTFDSWLGGRYFYAYRLAVDDTFNVDYLKSNVTGTIATYHPLRLQQQASNPASPASGTEGNLYIKGGKLIVQWNDAGTVRWKYLDLTGTGATWTHTTTAP
ncbi:MAG TPA: hypothetical protein VNQ79_06615 [Blastocatellia bacterium]|nr:hypothetical protein [Blastocatellia bacterium]